MKTTVTILIPLLLLLASAPAALAQKKKAAQAAAATAPLAVEHKGDVTDVTVIRRLEQHPYAGKLWQPVIIQGEKKKDLVVVFGAELNGKSDMGDILVSLSNDDGDSWSEPVHVFDHRQRQGAIQCAYANPCSIAFRVRR